MSNICSEFPYRNLQLQRLIKSISNLLISTLTSLISQLTSKKHLTSWISHIRMQAFKLHQKPIIKAVRMDKRKISHAAAEINSKRLRVSLLLRRLRVV